MSGAGSGSAESLEQRLREIAAASPPNEWRYFDTWDGYRGYGKPGDADHVPAPDESNNDDLHAHGRAVGRWEIAQEIRAALGASDGGTLPQELTRTPSAGERWSIAKAPGSPGIMVLEMRPDENLGSVPTGRMAGMFDSRDDAIAVAGALNWRARSVLGEGR